MSFFSFLGGLLGIGPTRRTITISKSATNAGLPFIIGEARLKALPVYKVISRENGPLTGNSWDFKYDPRPSHGDEERKGKREWLHRIDVFSQGPITGYRRFYVDSDPHTSSRFGTRPYFRTVGYYGSDTQTSFSWGAVSSARGASHRGVGVAYTVSRFYAHGKYPKYRGEPPLEAVVQGSALYDPRNNAHVAGDLTTYEYDENPALGLIRYLTSNEGAEWSFSNLHIDSFKTAADFCDFAVSIPARMTNTSGSTMQRRNWELGKYTTIEEGEEIFDDRPDQVGTTQKRMKASFVLDPEKGIRSNVKNMLTVMHASLAFSNGQYKLIIEDAATSAVMSFDNDSILGNWKIDDGGRRTRLNRATVNFINKNKNYKEDSVSWPSLDSAEYAEYLAEDTDEKLHQTFDVDAIPDFYQARAWAEYKVRRSRTNRRVKVDLAPVAMLLEYGDVISLSSNSRGWTDEWFLVERVTLKTNGEVTVELIKYDPSIYSWALPPKEPVDDPGDAPFQWDDPAAISGMSAVEFHDSKADGSVISGFDVTWDAPTDIGEIEFIEIAYRKSLTNGYDTISRVPVDNTTVRLAGLQDNEDYDIRLTYRTALGLVSADAHLLFQTLSDAESRLSDIEDGATVNRPMFGLEAGQDESGANVQAVRIIGFDAVLTPVSVSFITNIPYDGGFINPTSGYKSVALISTDAPDGSYYVGYDKTKTQKFVMAGTTNRDMGILRKNGTVWEYLDYVTAGSYAWVSVGFLDDCIVIGEAHISGSAFSVASAYAQGFNLSSAPALGADVTDYDDNRVSNTGTLPPGMHKGGFGNIRFEKNKIGVSSANAGEMLILGTKFYHPDGTTRTIVSDRYAATNFEGNPNNGETGYFYLVYTDESPVLRFPGHGLDNTPNFFIAQYNWSTGVWNAISNSSNTYIFTPRETDCLVGVGFRDDATSTGITWFESLLGVNTDLPDDGADITADNNNWTDVQGGPDAGANMIIDPRFKKAGEGDLTVWTGLSNAAIVASPAQHNTAYCLNMTPASGSYGVAYNGVGPETYGALFSSNTGQKFHVKVRFSHDGAVSSNKDLTLRVLGIDGAGAHKEYSVLVLDQANYTANTEYEVTGIITNNHADTVQALFRFEVSNHADSGGNWYVSYIYVDTMADGADVTGDNTADDTSNINGFIASNIFDGNGRFKDLERVPATRAMGTGSARTSNPLTASDDGATAKISIAAHTIYVGDGTGIAYNAGTITGLSFSSTYAVYADDATFAGGAVTYVATTNFEDLGKALGRYYVGYVDTPADGGGSTGGGGGGGGEACIADDMWLMNDLLARDVKPGDTLELLNENNGVANGDGYSQSAMSGVSHSVQPCFEIETSGGAKLICSDTTPVTLRTGEMMTVGDCLGGELATIIDGHFEWQEVIKVEAVDPRVVAHVHINGRTFAAGAEARSRIFTHNMAKPLI